MSNEISDNKVRHYFIDWLRIGLIFSVFLYHIGMYFNSWSWHVKSDKPLIFLEPIMDWLHLWRMPLLFLVSGVGTYYALGFRTIKRYLKERFTRLFIPFFVGLFTLVPVQVYIERITSYNSLGHFYMHMFDGIYPLGNFSWHHLWFLIYLFLISLLISPFLNYIRSNKFEKIKHWILRIASTKLGLNWVVLILVLSQYILRQYFSKSTHGLIDDWAYFTYYLLFFLCGLVLFTSKTVINALAVYRRLYFYQTLVFSILYYAVNYLMEPSSLRYYIYLVVSIVVSWSCGITAIGYAKVYVNKDNKFRKPLNTAIYPFYLLHQPIIVVLGYFLLKCNLPILIQVVLLTVFSLLFTIGIYVLLVRNNVLRIVFGLKPKK